MTESTGDSDRLEQMTQTADSTSPPRRSVRAVIGRIALAVAMLAPILWATAALAIDFRIEVLAKPLAVIYAAANLYALWLVLRFPRTTVRNSRTAAISQAAAFLLVLIWWSFLRPSNERNWEEDVSRAPHYTIDPDNDDLITIHNVRSFHYRTTTDYDAQYKSRTVQLSDLKGLDFALCYWGSDLLAHPIATFRFGNAPPICFSIETRKEKGESYSAVTGFFRQYELIYVAAEESDVIRLRTNLRPGEWVYLYKTTASPERARKIFLDYLRGANELHDTPQWYNALTSNCTSNILIHTRTDDREGASRWDWRILLPGKVDELAYEMGRIGQGMEFEEFKKRSRIDGAALKDVPDDEFSKKLREGLPGF